MEAREIFIAALKVVGLLSIGRGLYDLFYILLYTLNLGDFSVTAKYPTADLIFGVFYLICGLYLLRGGDFIVNFAFPSREVKTQETEPDTTPKTEI